MTSMHINLKQRNNFKRIIGQLDRKRSDSGVLKVFEQAQALLDEENIGWDAVQLYVHKGYLFKNQRKAAAKVATAIHPKANGGYPLGKDGRALLKTAVSRHPDWPVVREYLGVDMGQITVADLIAVAQLLKMDERFVNMFRDKAEEPGVKDLEEILAEKQEKENGEV